LHLFLLRLAPAKYAANAFSSNIDIRKISRFGSRSPGTQIWSLQVVVLQRTENKCTVNYNARAQPLFFSLNLFFSDVLVAVATCFAWVPTREFWKVGRKRRGRRRLKIDFIFYLGISRYSKVIYSLFLRVKTITKLNLGQRETLETKISNIAVVRDNTEFGSFHIAVLQKTAKKCIKNYNARAHPLLCSLKLLFCVIAVLVDVVIFPPI